MKCKVCSSDNLVENVSSFAICQDCGALNEDLFMTNSLNFTENNGTSKLSGEIIRMTDTYAKVGGNIIRSTNFEIQNRIKTICDSLGISEEMSISAFRWYKLSLQGNLTRGRSILYTISACIYVVCRQEKTPHLLMDFAHLLEIDVFKIGAIFVKIVVLLNIKVPLIDPSLFLNRFCKKLKFKNNEILQFSMRLVSRMKRDWIVTGRTPNNVCGAALVLASRVFGEERSIHEVAKVVRGTYNTINSRLSEINDTQSANLTISDFKTIWLEKEEDPPVTKVKNKLTIEKEIKIIHTPGEDIDEIFDFTFDEQFLEKNEVSNEEINSSEIEDFILTENEANQKENIWNEMFSDYIENKNEKINVKKKEKKIRQKETYETVEDALKGVLKEKRMTTKINYEALKDLFQ